MRNWLNRLLKDTTGETISETLVALLVSALALVMLAGAISASAGMVTRSRDKLNNYYSKQESENGVIKMAGTGFIGLLVMTDNTTETVDKVSIPDTQIEYYENTVFGDEKKVIAYKKAGSTP